MRNANKIINLRANEQNFDMIKISIASPEKILSWSYGEVKKPETINYRTSKPEPHGLFCARIFGPIKDYECWCGKYKRMKHKGIVCEKCGVEVTLSKVRRERMGHIELAAPVAHIWFTKSLPSRIGLLLDLSLKDLEKILYFENYIVIEPGLTPLKMHQLLGEEEYYQAQEEYGIDSFTASIGAEALHTMLQAIDLKAESDRLQQEIKDNSSEIRRKKLVKTLKLVDSFLKSDTRPEWMILKYLPVLPPDLRPLVPLDGGRFASSDLNDLYRRVINRNNRLKKLMEIKAPEIILRNEQRMLQEAVDALFDNSRRGRMTAGKRLLKSISDNLKGKQGRFRQNLLGKRVDYSGRSVIVVGPDLKLHQCGLPKKMALELFKPFIFSRLEKYGLATTIKAAKRMVEKEKPEIWEVLEEVIREHPVLLNRAPTLHRLGIQAFEPVLVEGKSIQLHPLVCTAFNADFDGDQMAVHLPLSLESQLEARVLMMSTNNILSPSSGKPIIQPTKDSILGIYYLTLMREGLKGEGNLFSSIDEIEIALKEGAVELHSKIIARYQNVDKEGKKVYERVETTPGRMIFSTFFPKHHSLPFKLINTTINSKEVANLLDAVYRTCGQKETVIFADKIMSLGFHYSTISGISFGKDDLKVPANKSQMIDETFKKVSDLRQQYQDGLITNAERYNKVIDLWARCSDALSDLMMKEMSKVEEGQEPNAIYMMATSGARGSVAQMRQFAAMRGLMVTPSGEVIETPILSNFKEGLSPSEYFNSTHGSRKGLTDVALRTANSGYLTRKLVDVAQDCIVLEHDCGTKKYFNINAVSEGGQIVSSLSERLLGRVAAKDVLHPTSGEVMISVGAVIEERDVKNIEEADIDSVPIRSVLTCETKNGVCSLCYGRDLARGELVNIGEAVGVIAAQSIGEPGTQLTMRNFHTGGTAQRSAEQSAVEASLDGTIKFLNINWVVNSDNNPIVMSRHGEIALIDDNGRQRSSQRIPLSSKLWVKDGQKVTKGTRLAEWDPYVLPIITEKEGTVKFMDLVEGVSFKEVLDESTGITNRVVVDWKQQSRNTNIKPRIIICDKNGEVLKLPNGMEARYDLNIDAILNVDNGDHVKVGDAIARMPKESAMGAKDITGGLPRISELFEARHPASPAIISEFDGYVEASKDYKNKCRILITPVDKNQKPLEYMVPKWRHILVQEGDNVKRGDLLVDGNPVAHDILHILGLEDMAAYMIKEIQDVYRMQGIRINDKHIEVIIRQMLQKVEVVEPGDTPLLVGEQLDIQDLEEIEAEALKNGTTPPKVKQVLQGITKAALQTRSFISAASFQETTRVLTDAATSGKVDHLRGLKENVIAGRLIPAGTGRVMKDFEAIALQQDLEELLAKKAELEAASREA